VSDKQHDAITPDPEPALVAGKDSEVDSGDPLHLREVFPSAHSVFSFAPKPFAEWSVAAFTTSDAIFVLDTNVLLLPYGASQESIDTIKETYRKLAAEDRLVVPGHVAREFARNRPRLLKALFNLIGQRRDGLQAKSIDNYPLFSDTETFKAFREAEQAHCSRQTGIASQLRPFSRPYEHGIETTL
jgi:hypothetical protein